MIEVFVSDRLGMKVAILMNEEDTIGDLKLMISTQTGIDPDRIRLQTRSRVYKDHITLADYEIGDGFYFELQYH